MDQPPAAPAGVTRKSTLQRSRADPTSLGDSWLRCVLRGVDGLRGRIGVACGACAVRIGCVAELGCVLQVGLGHLHHGARGHVVVAGVSRGTGRPCRSCATDGPGCAGRAGGACGCAACGGRLVRSASGRARARSRRLQYLCQRQPGWRSRKPAPPGSTSTAPGQREWPHPSGFWPIPRKPPTPTTKPWILPWRSTRTSSMSPIFWLSAPYTSMPISLEPRMRSGGI